MLKIITVKPSTERLGSGELATFLPIPELSYVQIEPDLDEVKHLEAVRKINLSTINDGVIIKCKNRSDGMLAAAYLIRKYELQQKQNKFINKALKYRADKDDYDEEYPSGDDPFDSEDDADEYLEPEEIHDFMYNDDNLLVNIPIISTIEFRSAFFTLPRYEGIGNFNYQVSESQKPKKPFWVEGKFPLIITDTAPNPFGSNLDIDTLKLASDRFLIYIFVEQKTEGMTFNAEGLNNQEQRILFELDFALCSIEEASSEYYSLVLSESCSNKGFTLDESLDKEKLIEDLKSYRSINFEGASDIVTMLVKVIKRKTDNSGILSRSDFDFVFTARELRKQKEKQSKSSARTALDNLIGLEDVKAQLYRIVDNLKFAKQRKVAGYKTTDTHIAAVFMGNPGSAKTTVARLFGQILYEENILNSNEFVEVSRKDLVGRFVGWTAPTVSKIWEQAKSGTIFIDEAYSLLNEGHPDGYSEEALSEIVRQMENNPDTLVIFAGYTDRMRQFIKMANPGLRSRLSNVIEFKKYDNLDMYRIFEHLLTKEDFTLDDRKSSEFVVSNFVEEIRKLGSENTGNGRLMRRLFNTSVGFMAQREDNDLKTITLCDIQNAVAEVTKAEKLVSNEKVRIVGFNNI